MKTIKRHQPYHIYFDNTLYFLTSRCYKGEEVIQPKERRDFIRDLLKKIFTEYNYRIYAWVILPNHYHLLFKSRIGTDLAKIMQSIHGKTSRLWNVEDRTPGRKVWTNYWDYCIRDEEDFFKHFNYIHFNPVKHGYVDNPKDWEHSSYRWYLKRKGSEWMKSCFEEYPIRYFKPVYNQQGIKRIRHFEIDL